MSALEFRLVHFYRHKTRASAHLRHTLPLSWGPTQTKTHEGSGDTARHMRHSDIAAHEEAVERQRHTWHVYPVTGVKPIGCGPSSHAMHLLRAYTDGMSHAACRMPQEIRAV
jgi:hypothetical protein